VTEFGRDTSCTTELRSGRFATGPRLVAEAAYRRLSTPRGMLRGGEEEAEYGLDLMDMIGNVVTKSDAAALGGRIRSELTKDERIQTADVVVERITAGPSTSYQITIIGKTSEGPFDLQLAASDVTIELLGIKADG